MFILPSRKEGSREWKEAGPMELLRAGPMELLFYSLNCYTTVCTDFEELI